VPVTSFWLLSISRLQHLALRREPEAVIDQLRVARHQLVFQVHRAAVERDRFHRPVGGEQDRAARGLVDAARFHADEAVLDEIDAADAVVAAESFSLANSVAGLIALPFSATASPFSKLDLDLGRLVRRVHRVETVRIWTYSGASSHGSSSTLPSEEECSMLASTENGASPRLSFGTGIWWFCGEIDQVGARLERPVAPWRDHLDVRVERIGRQLEADLVVALAGGAMGNGVGAGFLGDLDQRLEISGRAIEVPSR
jgi:hypothetical protein